MSKGLDVILEKIRAKPSGTLVARYLALIAELPDEREKSQRALAVAELLVEPRPADAMRIAHMVFQTDRANLRALDLLIACFVARGRHAKAEVLRIERAKLTSGAVAAPAGPPGRPPVKQPARNGFTMDDDDGEPEGAELAQLPRHQGGGPGQGLGGVSLSELDLGDAEVSLANVALDDLFPKDPAAGQHRPGGRPAGAGPAQLLAGFAASTPPGDTVMPFGRDGKLRGSAGLSGPSGTAVHQMPNLPAAGGGALAGGVSPGPGAWLPEGGRVYIPSSAAQAAAVEPIAPGAGLYSAMKANGGLDPVSSAADPDPESTTIFDIGAAAPMATAMAPAARERAAEGRRPANPGAKAAAIGRTVTPLPAGAAARPAAAAGSPANGAALASASPAGPGADAPGAGGGAAGPAAHLAAAPTAYGAAWPPAFGALGALPGVPFGFGGVPPGFAYAPGPPPGAYGPGPYGYMPQPAGVQPLPAGMTQATASGFGVLIELVDRNLRLSLFTEARELLRQTALIASHEQWWQARSSLLEKAEQLARAEAVGGGGAGTERSAAGPRGGPLPGPERTGGAPRPLARASFVGDSAEFWEPLAADLSRLAKDAKGLLVPYARLERLKGLVAGAKLGAKLPEGFVHALAELDHRLPGCDSAGLLRLKWELVQGLWGAAPDPACAAVLEELTLTRATPGFWGLYLDALLSGGGARRALVEVRRGLAVHPQLLWARVAWARMPQIWQALSAHGFAWSEDDGVATLLALLARRPRPKLAGLVAGQRAAPPGPAGK